MLPRKQMQLSFFYRRCCGAKTITGVFARTRDFGIAKKMDISSMKSKYCTIEATTAFETLI